jgi:hypothetical protein
VATNCYPQAIHNLHSHLVTTVSSDVLMLIKTTCKQNVVFMLDSVWFHAACGLKACTIDGFIFLHRCVFAQSNLPYFYAFPDICSHEAGYCELSRVIWKSTTLDILGNAARDLLPNQHRIMHAHAHLHHSMLLLLEHTKIITGSISTDPFA